MNPEDITDYGTDEFNRLKALFEKGTEEYAYFIATVDELIELLPSMISSAENDQDKLIKAQELHNTLGSDIDAFISTTKDRILNLKDQLKALYARTEKSLLDYQKIDSIRAQLERALAAYGNYLNTYIQQAEIEKKTIGIKNAKSIFEKLKRISKLQNPSNPEEN